MTGYKRLSLEEREKIYLLNKSSVKRSEIANFLGRYKSTISRELGCFCGEDLGF